MNKQILHHSFIIIHFIVVETLLIWVKPKTHTNGKLSTDGKQKQQRRREKKEVQHKEKAN
jgi:hypothetical protein